MSHLPIDQCLWERRPCRPPVCEVLAPMSWYCGTCDREHSDNVLWCDRRERQHQPARTLADLKAIKAHLRQLEDNAVAAQVLVLLDRVLELRA